MKPECHIKISEISTDDKATGTILLLCVIAHTVTGGNAFIQLVVRREKVEVIFSLPKVYGSPTSIQRFQVKNAVLIPDEFLSLFAKDDPILGCHFTLAHSC